MFYVKITQSKSFPLIDDLEIEFESGLTALTGRNWCWKTIILESLHLCLVKEVIKP